MPARRSPPSPRSTRTCWTPGRASPRSRSRPCCSSGWLRSASTGATSEAVAAVADGCDDGEVDPAALDHLATAAGGRLLDEVAARFDGDNALEVSSGLRGAYDADLVAAALT